MSVWASPSCIQLDTRIREIQPTEKEFMLLRIRSFFRPCKQLVNKNKVDSLGVGHTEEGYAVIIQTRLKLAVRLGEYIREMNPHFTEEQVKSRLGQLLELETLLKVEFFIWINVKSCRKFKLFWITRCWLWQSWVPKDVARRFYKNYLFRTVNNTNEISNGFLKELSGTGSFVHGSWRDMNGLASPANGAHLNIERACGFSVILLIFQ